MKKKICILGSTGSIGKTTLEIISKNKKDFDVVLLSGNNNVKLLITQAKKFKPKYIYSNNFYFKDKLRIFCKDNNINLIDMDENYNLKLQIPMSKKSIDIKVFDDKKNVIDHTNLIEGTQIIIVIRYLGIKFLCSLPSLIESRFSDHPFSHSLILCCPAGLVSEFISFLTKTSTTSRM